MTHHAREVLRDCETALEELMAGPPGVQWRIRWVATVALLRAVGHVLLFVDAEADPAFHRVVDAEFDRLRKTKPKPIIFWEFIKRERDNVVKEYQFGVRENVNITPGTAGLSTTGASSSSAGSPTTYEHTMRSGRFAGQDPRDVVKQAITWWRQYLDEIDRRASEAAT